MFGLSFAKVLLLVLVVAVVWFGFRWLQDLTTALTRDKSPSPRGGGVVPPSEPMRTVEDLTACPRCRAYVPTRSATACGRGDCPYPRPR